MKDCPFCLPNGVLRGDVLYEDELWYFVTTESGELKHGGMIITKRHVGTPFEIEPQEWHRLGELLPKFKSFIDQHNPQGYNLGWNVNPIGGQKVAHAHLHLMGRFDDEPMAGKGIRHAFRLPSNKRGLKI